MKHFWAVLQGVFYEGIMRFSIFELLSCWWHRGTSWLMHCFFFLNFPLQNSWFDRIIGWQRGENNLIMHLLRSEAFHEILGTSLYLMQKHWHFPDASDLHSCQLASFGSKPLHKQRAQKRPGLVRCHLPLTFAKPMRYHEICPHLISSKIIEMRGFLSLSFKASPQSLARAVLAWGCPKKEVRDAARHPVAPAPLSRCIQVSCFLLWRPLCSPGRRDVKHENPKRGHVKLRLYLQGGYFFIVSPSFFEEQHKPLCTPRVLDLSLSLMIGHVHLLLHLILLWSSRCVFHLFLRFYPFMWCSPITSPGEDHSQPLLGFLDLPHVTCFASSVFHPIHCHPSLRNEWVSSTPITNHMDFTNLKDNPSSKMPQRRNGLAVWIPLIE